ncbi:MAG: NUDIX hydrolase [Candidatus Nanoarchaeia archaeon]
MSNKLETIEKELDNFQKPSVTVDVIIFTITTNKLKVLLIKARPNLYKDSWVIPGGFIDLKQSLETAAKIKLEEKTGVKEVYLEQLYTFGEPKRDPRGRVITVSYFALVNYDKIQILNKKEHDVEWFDIAELPKLGFDHKDILNYALQRLKWKFEYTSAAFSLLPEIFTMTQLQELYEIVFGTEFDKRNFRKKILSLNILKERGFMKDVSFRPPMTYSLKPNIEPIINII